MADEPSRPRAWRVWTLTFIAFVVSGVAWTMAMPPMAQPDEPAHAQRAAAVARGQFTWKAREDLVAGDFFGIRRTNTILEVPEGYSLLEEVPVCFVFEPGATAVCAPRISSSDEIVDARSYTGTYPPFAAIVQAPGGWFDAPVGVVVMRLCTVLVTAALLASAVVSLTRLRSALVVAGFALCLTPLTLSIMAAINPSALELAASACLWLSLLELLHAPDAQRSMAWRTVIAATVLILSRPTTPLLFVAIVAVVMIAAPWRDRLRALARARRAWAWLTVVGAALVFAVGWLLVARPDRAVIGIPDPRPVGDVLRDSLSLIPRRTGQMVAPIGWLDIELPQPVVSAWLAVVAVLVFVALLVGRWRQRLALLALVAGVVLGPTLSELPAADEVGLPWQGRYTLGVAMGLPILAAWTLHQRGADRFAGARAAAIGVVVAVAAIDVVAIAGTLTRHATGTSWPLDVPFGAQPWSDGVQGWMVLVLAVASMGLLGTILVQAILRPPNGAAARTQVWTLDAGLPSVQDPSGGAAG